jgi:uncharacterized protein
LDYPQYDPQLDNPPLDDAELDALDGLLQALPGDAVMNVEALDGYLSALVAGPPGLAALRSADWLPTVWGGDGEGSAPFASQKQRKRAAVLVLRHLHAVRRQLHGDPAAWQPVFSIAEAGDREWVDAEDWCAGFLQATALAPDAWGALFDDVRLGPALLPVALLGMDDSGLSDADRQRLADPEQRDALSRAVVDGVLALMARTLAAADLASEGAAGAPGGSGGSGAPGAAGTGAAPVA